MAYVPFEEMIKQAPTWRNYMTQMAETYRSPRFPMHTEESFSETRDWKAVTALLGLIPMASMIDRADGKPIIGTEKPLDMFGTMPTFGNKVVFTSKEFNDIKAIERAIAKYMDKDPEKTLKLTIQALKYVKQYMERLAVGPLMTIDKLFYEAWSNGTSTITASENLAKVDMSIDWQISKGSTTTVWSDAAKAKGIDDLRALAKRAKLAGVIIDRFTMNDNTVALLLNQASVKSNIVSSFSSGELKEVKYSGTPSLDALNLVLKSNFRLPPIVIEDYMVAKYNADGITTTTSNAFLDGRVTASVGDILGTYIYTPADEEDREDADAMYQVTNNVLISKRNRRGKVTFESELNAIPIPTAMSQMFILVTDATE